MAATYLSRAGYQKLKNDIKELKKGEKARSEGKAQVIKQKKDVTKKRERLITQWRKKVARLEKKKTKKHGGANTSK